MKLRQGKVGKSVLSAFALICIIFFIIEVGSVRRVKARFYEEKITAAQICERAFGLIKALRASLAIPIDEINDPNETGLIGHQWTLITSGRSDLQSKLTSTNPNFAALFVELLHQVGVRKGDWIAIGWTGSYPALNIALLSAVKVLELKPIIITSLSASMWGANDPRLTWLDMEDCLKGSAVGFKPSIAASLGGEDDNGQGLSLLGRAILDSIIKQKNIKKIAAANLAEQIENRLNLYWQAKGDKKIAAFVNIDRGAANLGDIHAQTNTGILVRHNSKVVEPSVIGKMLVRKVPVINVLDVNYLAEKYSLPIAPTPLPKLGSGKLFTEPRYSVPLAIGFIILVVVILFFVIRYDLEFYLLPKEKQKEILEMEGR
uniref:Poly-gamma-glutamate system protein n=1 Tax=candidate division WOR-3 bacterium TaxID=2052148 RepID=A0A7C6A815_UNCW3